MWLSQYIHYVPVGVITHKHTNTHTHTQTHTHTHTDAEKSMLRFVKTAAHPLTTDFFKCRVPWQWPWDTSRSVGPLVKSRHTMLRDNDQRLRMPHKNMYFSIQDGRQWAPYLAEEVHLYDCETHWERVQSHCSIRGAHVSRKRNNIRIATAVAATYKCKSTDKWVVWAASSACSSCVVRNLGWQVVLHCPRKG